jgi:hypothetical protein
MIWKVKEAQAKFQELIGAADTEPQPIYNQDRMVAVVIEPAIFQKFLDWQHSQSPVSLSAALTSLRQICEEEDYILEIPARRDRSNPFE